MIHLPLPDVDLQVAVLVHHEGCEFEVPVDNASGVDEFETLEYLIDEGITHDAECILDLLHRHVFTRCPFVAGAPARC